MNAYKVSIVVLTYNHERYIAQALESALMQRVDFEYEIIVGDDCSTDSTRNVVSQYADRFPEKMRLLLNGSNVGVARNFGNCMGIAQGDYIALLDGDDYWTSPDKLQDQVDFLDGHPEFVMCFTDSSVVDSEGGTIRAERLNDDRKKNLTQLEILNGLLPPANTVLFRNRLISDFPAAIYRVVNVDMVLFSLLTEYGDAGYMSENTACYRIHTGGVWSSRSQEYMLKNGLKTNMALLSIFSHKCEHRLLARTNRYFLELMSDYLSNKRIADFFCVLMQCVRTNINFSMHAFVKTGWLVKRYFI